MVERNTDPHRLVNLTHCTGRIPDGRTVPQIDRTSVNAKQPLTLQQMLPGLTIAAVVLVLLVLGLLRTAGVLS